MIAQFRTIFLSLMVLIALAGCGSRIGGSFELAVETIDEGEAVRMLQYRDGKAEGPMYELTFAVPDDLVGQLETRIEGNIIDFDVILDIEDTRVEDGFRRAPLFTVFALSNQQYWQQIGSYPGTYINIKNVGDTYFVYSVPPFEFYSGLSEEDYDAFSDDILAIVQSMQIASAEDLPLRG